MVMVVVVSYTAIVCSKLLSGWILPCCFEPRTLASFMQHVSNHINNTNDNKNKNNNTSKNKNQEQEQDQEQAEEEEQQQPRRLRQQTGNDNNPNTQQTENTQTTRITASEQSYIFAYQPCVSLIFVYCLFCSAPCFVCLLAYLFA
ncbi:unnamed protein product [Polarella glacialis]|uniref:Uncharacterized protein n=1 Tax=Polarella glacialis TaxID=89957 RepID=A0A813FRT6_POLGL|nr:unnamed protein product [Polarella glacialis]